MSEYKKEFESRILSILKQNIGRIVEIKLSDGVLYGKLDGFGYDGVNPLTLVIAGESGGKFLVNYSRVEYIRFPRK